MRPTSPVEHPTDIAARVCEHCGYDLRGSLAAGRCPECGEEPSTSSQDATTIAGESGLDLVANSLFASLPAIAGLFMLGLFGRIAAILALVGLGFRFAGLAKLRTGRIRPALPAGFRRLLWMSASAELAIAIPATVISVIPLGIPSSGLWSIGLLGAWTVVAGIGLASIGLAIRGIARSLETDWAAGAGVIAALLCLFATVVSTGFAAFGFLLASGGTPPFVIPGVVALGALAMGPLAGLLGVSLARMLLLSVETHAISTVIDALSPVRNPLRELRIPTARSGDAGLADDPLPLEPSRPPIREDL